MEPHARIEEGRRPVRFDPPAERLEGVRIHEWLGARQGVGRWAGDLERIWRQQAFVRARCCATGSTPAARSGRTRSSGRARGPGREGDLSRVTAEWTTTAIRRGVYAT